MASIDQLDEQIRQAVRQKLNANTTVTPEQILENIDRQEQAAAEYSESDEDNAKTLETINRYRIRFGASPDITNADFIELIAENEMLPDRPVVEDDRSIWTIIRNVGAAVDSKYCGWTDSYTGKFVFAAIVALVIGFAFVPGAYQRHEAFVKGYQECKLRADVGVPCEQY